MMVSTEHLKGILTICGGVLIHLSLGTLYTFGKYSSRKGRMVDLEFVITIPFVFGHFGAGW